ncbi:aldose epimerase [Candidatus Synechococcus calcipolaris G9]|uniref:Aldose epimerase n=1 Tax=Candidatus Synechococcus calcipolaris G9 TaxID=1497997 RepID=A0ABT6EU74_9SYNE|nr:aldose epimerase [Candidatus Synechococcus calcipolaris]MDG2989439.1 aldose epimerase [Candidatus Synechococcus calcipolaris G9]
MAHELICGESRLTVVPERGGLISGWQWRGQEILYLDRDRFANPDLSVRGGIPILFPICGNLPNNEFIYEDQKYSLKQHGFARDLPWQVQDHQGNSIVLRLGDTEATRGVYPFEFDLEFTYTLGTDSLGLELRITNPGERPLPFSLGLHPYFAVQEKEQLTFNLPINGMVDQKTQRPLTFAGGFDWAAPELDLACRPLLGHRARVSDRQRGYHLDLNFSPEFTTLVFWTLHGKDYYCLEPWTAPRNALNSGVDLIHLPPQASMVLQVELHLSAI